ncbi:response regulator [Gillisia sp. M10.2A]|uniref:Response regulator n=1 Tax=Gillisia lutea TaxID=2909668 RepID=A0ABS9EIS3_9FLAO|nr:response regulator [Gillisia lutea]MCF4102688.1 response regulator [Gillisia lutea]
MNPINILLVEDNEGDILLTTEALSEGKIANRVDVARDGWEAIQFLNKNGKHEHALTPDLILLDINLPKLNGHEVLQEIKSSENLKHLPVIMLSTSSSDQDIISSYKNFANCYITKPVEVNDFLKVISSIENFWVSIVQLPKEQ